MSVAYFLASLSVIALCLAIVLWLYRPRATAYLLDWIALSGVRSFAVVPLRYLLRTIAVKTFGPIFDLASYLRAMVTVLALSFAGSALVPLISDRLKSVDPKVNWASQK